MKLLLFVLAFSVLFYCCGSPEPKTETASEQAQQMGQSFNSKDTVLNKVRQILNAPETAAADEYGKAVPLAAIKQCTDKYINVMKDYGFEETEEDVARSRTNKRKKITWYEAFRGKELFEWIANIPAPAGGNTMIELRVINGMYTDTFLIDHVATEDERKKRKNRHSFFMVAFKKGTNDTLGTEAFDLGGLKP